MNIRISILTKLICIALVFGLIPTRVLAAENSADEQITFVRLTSDQYRNAIRDIFGESIQVSGNAASTGVREAGLMAVGGRRLTLSAAEVETYEVLALDIASQVLSPSRRATLIPCQPRDESAADNTCASTFIESVGLHLFRRPLSKPEIETYAAMAATATESLGDFYAGLQSALVGMMVAPDFLFRIERSVSNPEQPGMRRLDAWSRASRLSFFLWDTTPNPALLEAARNGDLLFEDGLIQQVDQMMGSARIEDGLRAFFADMLAFDRFDTLDIDTNLFPKFTKNVEDEAREQTLRTISHHLLNNNADYRDLFDSRETFLTPALAALYGVPIPIRQELGGRVPWVAYTYPEDHVRVGLLGQATFLSLFSHPGASSPTLRGKAVREHLLCQTIPPPPGDVDFSLVRDGNHPDLKTVRDRLTQHRENPTCAGCHMLMDPIGLALEIFDASGVYRTMENGETIDTSGQWAGQEYVDVRELATLLKDDPTLTSCLIQRAYNYGTAREPSRAEVQWLNATHTQLRDEGVHWRELMQRISKNPDFYTVPEAATN
ncbi:MAG: DUF1592 domain-containing protein [Gammaproteobacteria bacterium]|nr:DUF1592 domain-containing protein [Gammaproteobacteria bacterium]